MNSDYPQVRKLLLTLCLCAQLAACGVLAETSAQISPQELVAQIEAGTAPLILDVRTVEEYEAGHIPGAINIHFREINDRLDEIPFVEGQPVVVYCERGIRANVAEQTLQAAGIASVLHLEGDISKWRQNNLPLVQGDSSLDAEARQLSFSKETENAANSLENRWLVSASEAKRLIEQGATLLDTRKLALKRLHTSLYVDWRQFSPEDAATRGRLLAEEALLTQRLQAMGISQDNPVVVFANPPDGWGEDGRIVWMLRTLGHSQVVMVDGGFNALIAAGVPVQQGKKETPAPGDFVIERNPTWEIDRDQLKALIGQENVVVIDTREAREFSGKTPYGEQRGGHVPGAINLYFKSFLRDDGKLLPPSKIREILENTGITTDTNVVVYCTGGIRSGWLAAVLVTLGYDVQNYAGSMWEWSAGPADRYPLETL